MINEKDVTLTAAELIRYLRQFRPDDQVAIVTLDCHKEQKVAFDDKEVLLIADTKQPAIVININTSQTEDITRGHEEACAENKNPAKDVKSPKLPTKKCYG